MRTPTLSIVTVSYNAAETIGETIESILGQTFTDYEYIVVDGLSTDDTCQIVRRYEHRFQEKGIRFRHISEKDTGIYNAMNKGTDMASGKWINFMNADDRYASDDVLERIFGDASYEGCAVVYGDVNHIKGEERTFVPAGAIEGITNAMVFSHQSTFIRTEIQREYRFREKYRIGADYDMLLRTYLAGERFQHVECVVADFSLTGFCNSDKYKTYLEVLNIQEENGVIDQRSMGIRLRKIFHYYRLKYENNKVLAFLFNQMIQIFGRS